MVKKDQFDYGTAQRRLEEIVASLQSTETSVEDALKLYEEGMELAKSIEKYLENTEQLITKLTMNK